MKEIIKLSHVGFSYDERSPEILKNINLSIYEGEWLAIIGHNGSGKSTLAKLLNGLLIPTTGTVEVAGMLTNNQEDLWEIRRQVGLVFQNPENQIVGTTVRDDIAFGLENLGISRDEMFARIEKSARIVGLFDFLDEEPFRLSGGQKQRLAIAGILAVEPKVMIFDEATSMLDPIGRKEVISTIQQLNGKEGITIVSITHDLNEAALADRIAVFNQGSIIQIGTPREIFSDGENLRKIGLDLPFTVLIAEKLKERGIMLENICLTNEELVDELWKLT